jgi:hypothetical protein
MSFIERIKPALPPQQVEKAEIGSKIAEKSGKKGWTKRKK